MNLEKLNQWLATIANLGVLVGIIFLAIEIQQNTNAVKYEAVLAQQEVVNGPFTNTDRLPEILAQIHEVQGGNALPLELSKVYNLSMEDSLRWARYLTQIWQTNEADWLLLGEDESICEYSKILLISAQDNEIYWRIQQGRYDPRFVECIESAADPRQQNSSN